MPGLRHYITNIEDGYVFKLYSPKRHELNGIGEHLFDVIARLRILLAEADLFNFWIGIPIFCTKFFIYLLIHKNT